MKSSNKRRLTQRVRDWSIFNKLLISHLLLATVIIALMVSTYFFIRQQIIWVNEQEMANHVETLARVVRGQEDGRIHFGLMRDMEVMGDVEAIYVGRDMVSWHVPHEEAGLYLARGEDYQEEQLEGGSVIASMDVELVGSLFEGNTICDIGEVQFVGERVLYAGAPVYAPDEEEPVGAVILYRPFSYIRELTMNLLLPLLIAFVIAVGASIMLTAVLVRWLGVPIEALTYGARQMAAGHYGERISIDQKDEVGQLGNALDQLSAQLQEIISALQEERSKLRQILSGIGEGIVAVDAEGKTVHVNNTALDLMELSGWLTPEEGENGARRDRLMDMLRRAVEKGESGDAVWTYPGGRAVAVQVWPTRGTGGQRIGAVGLLRDVSEAEKLEQMRRDYVANISHELRTPLTGIRGMVEPLLDGYIETEEERMKFYRVIYQETLRLEKLIGEMLDMSRLQAGRVEMEMEPVNVESVMEAARQRMRDMAHAGGVKVEIRVPEGLGLAVGVEDRVLQVLIILLDNALAFTPAGGSVTMYAREEGDRICVGVRDTGAGIDPADMPYIWERFYKADKSRLQTRGTGLGLAIARLVVEYMGGEIHADSQPGHGATFEFTLAKQGAQNIGGGGGFGGANQSTRQWRE